MKKQVMTVCCLAALFASTVNGQEEAPKRVPPEPGELAARMLADFDGDASSSLNEAELAEALDSIRQNRARPPRAEGIDQPPPPPRERKRPDPAQIAQRMLEHHDTNGDGVLSEDELTEAVASMPRPGRGGPGPRKNKG